jgi:predicted nucleotidyltransferase
MLDFLRNGQGEILNIFFNNPDQEYYFRELAKILDREPAYYQRQLNNLVDLGILQDQRKGNMRFFKLNKDYYLFSELKSIVSKTIGLEFNLKKLIDKLPDIEAAFIFGSIASHQENINSDIDLLLIGKTNQDLLVKELSKLENKLNREINYHLISRLEIIKKIKNRDSFFINIFASPLINLKGEPYEFINLS